MQLKEPREITTAGNHMLEGAVIIGYLIDQTGVRRQARLPDTSVLGIGLNIFSVSSAT